MMMIVIEEETNIGESAIKFLESGAIRGVSRTKIVLIVLSMCFKRVTTLTTRHIKGGRINQVRFYYLIFIQINNFNDRPDPHDSK